MSTFQNTAQHSMYPGKVRRSAAKWEGKCGGLLLRSVSVFELFAWLQVGSGNEAVLVLPIGIPSGNDTAVGHCDYE